MSRVSLLHEVSGQYIGDVKLVADFLGVKVGAHILSGHARGANIKSARIGKYVSYFIGQRDSEDSPR